MRIERVKSVSGDLVEIIASRVDAEAKRKLARAFFTEEAIFPMFPDEVCGDEKEIEIVGIWQSGDRTTLKLSNGETYRARPEAGDKYDAEKGVMMCLLKACGISSSDFLNVMNIVERVNPRKSEKTPSNKKSALKNTKKVG